MRRIVFAAFMMPVIASGAVYKCVDSDGGITFSDRACAGAAQFGEVEVKQANSGGTLGLPDDFRERNESRDIERLIRKAEQLASQEQANAPCKNFSSTALRTYIVKNQVVPGMTTADAVKAWGRPERINGSQYVYWWGTMQGTYFYVENGCVRAVDGAYRGSSFVR